MKIKPKFIAIVSSILLIFVSSFSIINFNAKTTQTSATTLSNKKIGWGIKEIITMSNQTWEAIIKE